MSHMDDSIDRMVGVVVDDGGVTATSAVAVAVEVVNDSTVVKAW